jgi:serine/threonine protein kinase
MSQSWERFKLVQSLGKGRFGETLLVKDLNEGGRLVAIKVPHDSDTERALINELISAAVLHASLKQMYHPNIVKYLGFDTYEERYVMVMEYVKGSDLRKVVGQAERVRPPMELGRAVRLMQHACAGLVAAHNARLQHNDIKPENILIEEQGDIGKLTDFSISRICRSTSSTAAMGGTYPYMAPETWHGRASFQSDIWSLGVTFYEMVTGRLPFLAFNLGDLKQKIDRDDPVPPREINRKLDARLDQVIRKTLEKSPRQRFQSAQELLSAIEVDLDRHILEARGLFNQGKGREAEELLRKLLESHECEAKLYLALGEIHNRMLQYAKSEQMLRRGVEKCANNAQLYLYLALVLDQNHSPEKVAAMERALELGLPAEQQRHAERLLASWKARGA